jgi:hypothetical protein
MITPNDKFLQHIQEENTPEFKKFKLISNEDEVLVNLIKNNIAISKEAKILDIGGREGYISLKLGKPENITVVDPDPVVEPSKDTIFIREKIQNADLGSNKYDLILAAHVWGDFERENESKEVLEKLLGHLADGGYLAICYNSNNGFMSELLSYAKNTLSQMRYDYFEEDVLRGKNFKKQTFTTPLNYESFEELGRACWMLFATAYDDISETGKKFIPFLEEHLAKPSFDLEQTLVVLQK